MSQRKAKQLRKLERKIDKIERWMEWYSKPWWERLFKGTKEKPWIF